MKRIVKMLFGSHLYGTNTEKSDRDYKTIFLEDSDKVLLGTTRKTIQNNTNNSGSKNSSDDTDEELIELKKFLYDAMNGQTYALDMLFAPTNFWISNDGIWIDIVSNRDKLISKNLKPYIGYCRQQAGKYGLKGSRLGELERVIGLLNYMSRGHKLIDISFELSEFVYWEELKGIKYLSILGKKYDRFMKIGDVVDSLQRMHDKYGDRSKLAMENNGIDWKAISHAYRCMFQLKELITTSKIQFPLKDRDYILKIKEGKISYDVIKDELPKLMDEVLALPNNLPDQPDKEFWDDFIIKTRIEELKRYEKDQSI